MPHGCSASSPPNAARRPCSSPRRPDSSPERVIFARMPAESPVRVTRRGGRSAQDGGVPTRGPAAPGSATRPFPEESPRMRRIVLTFGLISGGILSLMMLATMPFHDAIGNDAGMVIGYTTMVMAFLLVYFGVRSYRDNVAGGRVSFMKALGVGALIALVASICYVATWEAIYFGGKSDYIEKYQAREVEKARRDGKTEAQIAAKQAEMQKLAEMYQNPVFNSAITFMEPLPVALVIALVSAGILSRRRRDVPQPA